MSTSTRQIAAQAALLLCGGSVSNYRDAKERAVHALPGTRGARLPGNEMIDAEIVRHRALFDGPEYDAELRRFRVQALHAMAMFDEYDPRLHGAAVSGALLPDRTIRIHLHADNSEAVACNLMEKKILFTQSEGRLKYSGAVGKTQVIRFVAGEDEIELTILPDTVRRQTPRSPDTSDKIRRLNQTAARKLLGSVASE